MSRVIHFEIHVDDVDRAINFYKEIFGWKFDKWDGPQPYWLVTTGPDSQPGINGGLMKRLHPEGATYNSIDVPSVDDFAAKITKKGGEVVVPKMPIQGVGFLAYCKDTEGNIFGIFETDASAK
ncbi:MAG: VOC family protein [candidate division Zixibacteria bacterium]|nr:VOC family protein [candidate division Zixibacteria bacterium]